MERASWATLTLCATDERGRHLHVTTRVVIVHYRWQRGVLVEWWPTYAMRVGAWNTCPN